MVDLRQTIEYSKYMQSIGWVVERIDGINYFIRKIPIIGSVIKIQHPKKISYKVIELLSKKYRAFQIILEPKYSKHISYITGYGFRLNKIYFAPSKTLQIDLSKSEKLLLSEMHQKTRYNIKKFLKSNFQFSIGRDIERFANFWQKCAIEQRGMYLSQKREIVEIFKAFGKNAKIISIYKGGELLSAILLILTKDSAHYVYAAATSVGKKFFTPTLNAWKCIKLAKKWKRKIFDFEGIYDERFPEKSWLGFTRFKKSFGGIETDYPGCYTKFRFPF